MITVSIIILACAILAPKVILVHAWWQSRGLRRALTTGMLNPKPAAPAPWFHFLHAGVRPHLVPACLRYSFEVDMESRGATLFRFHPGSSVSNPETITEWRLDVGGAVHLERPIETFSWCGLTLHVPSEDVPRIAARLGTMTTRKFADGAEHVAITIQNHTTLMTPTQAEKLLTLLRDRLDLAEERARRFEEAVQRGAAQGVN